MPLEAGVLPAGRMHAVGCKPSRRDDQAIRIGVHSWPQVKTVSAESGGLASDSNMGTPSYDNVRHESLRPLYELW